MASVIIEQYNTQSGAWKQVKFPVSMAASLLKNQQLKYGRILFRLPEGVSEEVLKQQDEPILTPPPTPCVGCVSEKKNAKVIKNQRKVSKPTDSTDDTAVSEG